MNSKEIRLYYINQNKKPKNIEELRAIDAAKRRERELQGRIHYILRTGKEPSLSELRKEYRDYKDEIEYIEEDTLKQEQRSAVLSKKLTPSSSNKKS